MLRLDICEKGSLGAKECVVTVYQRVLVREGNTQFFPFLVYIKSAKSTTHLSKIVDGDPILEPIFVFHVLPYYIFRYHFTIPERHS